jgi:hypothetical protein
MEKIREVVFEPYWEYPKFRVEVFDIYTTYNGKNVLGYTFYQINGEGDVDVIFKGKDFGCSPLHAIDSDETIKSLMSFLTLRLGDTDAEYFKDYSEKQKEFSEQHAEALSWTVAFQFPSLSGSIYKEGRKEP